MLATTIEASPHVRRLRQFWRSQSLARRFLASSTIVIIGAMAVVGAWIASRIESAVSQNSAIDAALYVEALVGDRIQGLAEGGTFDPAVQRDLEQLVLQTPLGRRVLSFKVWVSDGRVIYASSPEHVGKRYPITENLKGAFQGVVRFEFDQLNDAEDALERRLNMMLLEIYVPLRKHLAGDVFAVVEFYEDATTLAADIARAKTHAWLLLATVGGAVVIALYGMARQASATIEQQQTSLSHRISDLSTLLAQNLTLRQRVEVTAKRAAELNERFLRRFGSDLHDGPAQLISLALFRLDLLHPSKQDGTEGNCNDEEKQHIKRALDQALKEIRELSAGLSVPELDDLSLSETIALSVRTRPHRTENEVRVEIGEPAPAARSREIKVATYRFVQEGLNNAARHAAGAKVLIRATQHHDANVIEVLDDGPGYDPIMSANENCLGIIGMRERIEGVAGAFKISSRPGRGTHLEARLPIS